MGIKGFNQSGDEFVNKFVRAVVSDSTGLDAVGGIVPVGLVASGGVISDYTDPGPGTVYRAHIFTSSGTFTVSQLGQAASNVEYLVVAGGGGGGGQHGGGGGAGGLRTNLTGHPLAGSAFPVSTSPGSYTVTVGGGGVRQHGGPYPYTKNSTSGGDSVFGSITSNGGGTGGNWNNVDGFNDNRQKGSAGGSGGGSGSCEGDSQAPEDYRGAGNTPSQSPSQGNPGGRGRYGGGGGGGAGAAASPNPPASPYNDGYGANGGAGVQVAIAGPTTFNGVGALNPGPGEYQWFAGGGGGGSYNTAPNPNYSDDNRPRGGVGGGGKGGFEPDGSAPDSNGEHALESTGGGGGGGGMAARDGGNGGSGIVVVRYQIGTLETSNAKATGGAISFYGGKTIHTFTSSGTFTAPSPLNPSPLSVECFIVAGGGGGGAGIGGGGGAGGVVYKPGIPISLGSPYTINVGAGGGGSVDPNGPSLAPQLGTDTTALGLTAKGGGGGGNGQGGDQTGNAGGSSGGTGSTAGSDPAAASQPGTSNPGAPINVGNVGGPGASTTNKGGGGGGAGGAATGEPMPTTGAAGTGGLAIQAPPAFRDPAQRSGPTPNPYDGGGLGYPGPGSSFHWFAGGGGGGAYNPAPATGGAGGGGTFAAPYGGAGEGRNDDPTGNPAGENSGSGGGGGGYSSSGGPGGNGGSGIVLIAYPT